MKTNRIIFNNKAFTFDSELLNKFFERMLYNEEKGEDENKCVISFLSNRFCNKTYEMIEKSISYNKNAISCKKIFDSCMAE